MTRRWAACVLLLVGCSLDRTGLRAPGPDADRPPTPDAAIVDADAGRSDAGPFDGSVPDAAPMDAARPDGGLPDAGLPDAGVPDAGLPDAGLPDTGLPDTGVCLVETCNGVDDDCDGQIDEMSVCGCPAETRGGSTYLFCTSPERRWDDARTYCMTRGYDLAILNDMAEDRWVWARTTGDDTWIGLHDMRAEAEYEWVDGTVIWAGGAARGFTNWRGGVPEDTASQDCAQMDGDSSPGQWADHPCSDPLPFVCETR
ncbi:MAG: lectin-like protein [Myxococcota bacterium]|nr:lectin-like protein [Myxococcota bacterium]